MRCAIVALVITLAGCGGAKNKPEEPVAVLPPVAPAVADGCIAALANEIARDANGEVWVDRAYLRAVLRSTDEDPAGANLSITRGADGGLSPIRVDRIQHGGLMDRLGFIDGDEIESVAGIPFIGLVEALKSYEAIKVAEKVVVQIIRRGERIQHPIHLCD